MLDEIVQVEAERADVLRQFRSGLLEGHEHAGFVELRRSPDQEFHRQQRLAAAGTSADQRGSAARQTTSRNFIQPLDARGSLGETMIRRRFVLGGFAHFFLVNFKHPSLRVGINSNLSRAGLARHQNEKSRRGRTP